MIQRERERLPFTKTVYLINKEMPPAVDLQAAFLYLIHPELIVFFLHLEISLRMQTCRANFRSFLTYSNVTAVTALPYHFAFFSEHSHIFDVVHESKVSFFVTFFSNSDIAIHSSNHRETFLFCYICEVGIIQ